MRLELVSLCRASKWVLLLATLSVQMLESSKDSWSADQVRKSVRMWVMLLASPKVPMKALELSFLASRLARQLEMRLEQSKDLQTALV